jgi:hypothetical protein
MVLTVDLYSPVLRPIAAPSPARTLHRLFAGDKPYRGIPVSEQEEQAWPQRRSQSRCLRRRHRRGSSIGRRPRFPARCCRRCALHACSTKRASASACCTTAEEAYVYSCRAFIRFHALHHPSQMGAAEVAAFQAVLELVRRSGNRSRQLPEHQYGVSRPRCA